jgi:hypothetical protein
MPQKVIETIKVPQAANYFSVNDPFNLGTIRTNARREFYTNLISPRADLRRILRIVEGSLLFIIKIDSGDTHYQIFSEQKGREKLKSVVLFKDGRTNRTMLDVLEIMSYESFMVKRYTMFSSDPLVFSTFGGYRVKSGKSSQKLLPYLFHQLLFNGISNSCEKAYNYINDWIAFVVQNPDKKTKVGIVLKGLMGTMEQLHSPSFHSLPPRD